MTASLSPFTEGEAAKPSRRIGRVFEQCTIDGCTRIGPLSRGMCSTHWTRWKKYGDPDHGGPVKPYALPVEDLFEIKVLRTDSCWEWQASKSNGYGTLRKQGKSMLAHRLSYEIYVGPIADGLQIDHLCRNRGCVNPDHLEPVTQQENLRRGRLPEYRSTHCKNGHEFTAENSRWRGNGRRCIQCIREYNKARPSRAKERTETK